MTDWDPPVSRVTAGVDLRLGAAAVPENLTVASIFVFLAERDNLSVPWGAKAERLGPSDTRSARWNSRNGAVPPPWPTAQGRCHP